MWRHVSEQAWYWSGTRWCSLSVMSELPPIAMTAVRVPMIRILAPISAPPADP